MTAGLNPYPAYKPSSVEWLGEVPAHWDVAEVKRHYSIQLGKMLQNHPNGPTDVAMPYLKAQHVQWFSVRTADAPTMWANAYEIEQFGIRAGDLLVCEGGEGGRCGLVEEIQLGYIIQNALHRVRLSGNSRNDYLQYVMSSIAQSGWFDAINSKATIAHFTAEKFGSLIIPIPPLAEQTAIVRYLDHTDGHIRRYLSTKERLIDLLKEYRQAVIHRTVTRGLDPNARLKPSGIEWLGDVPAHWEVRRLKNICRLAYGDSLPSKIRTEGKIPIYGSNGRIGFHSFSNATAPCIIIGRKGSFGKVNYSLCSAFAIDTTFFINSRYTNANIRWLYYLLGWLQLDAVSKDSAVPGLNREDAYQQVGLYLPLAEQTAIVAHLDKATADIDTAIDRAHREIALLSEYRTRLIADVVTGQLDVRAAAAQLPDESDADKVSEKVRT